VFRRAAGLFHAPLAADATKKGRKLDD